MLMLKKIIGLYSGLISVIAVLLVILVVIAEPVPTALAEEVKSASESMENSLLKAAAAGDIETVKLLISQGVDVDSKDEWFRTALHLAVENRHTGITQLLITEGADVKAKKIEWANTPLHVAAEKGYKDIAELLIAGGTDVNTTNRELQTPLHLACLSGSIDIAELLITKGADVDAKDNYGCTPLQSAIFKGHENVAKLLIAQGADVNAKNLRIIASIMAGRYGNGEIVKLLRKHSVEYGLSESPLIDVAALGDIESVKSLISEGADVNARNEFGDAPLFSAIFMQGHKDIVELLIAEGADVNVKNALGFTPLLLAAFEGYKDIAEILIANGADVNAKSNRGSALDAALQKGHTEIVELLREHGAKDSSSAGEDDTKLINSLHEAAASGNIEKVKLLISQGANINAKVDFGTTPLHNAAAYGRKEVAEFLIENGADVNAGNMIGSTLHNAVNRGHIEMVELLIAKGADVNLRNMRGDTPLDLAQLRGQTEIVELLLKHGAEEEDKRD